MKHQILYRKVILLKIYSNAIILHVHIVFSCFLEIREINCSITDNQGIMKIECECSLQNDTYQVILKSSRESSGNIITIRTECEKDLQIPVDPSLLYDTIIFRISNINGIIQYETLLYFGQSMSVSKDYTTELKSTKGSARKKNGIL